MIGVDFYACKANTANKDHPEMAFTNDLTFCGYKKKTKEIQQESKFLQLTMLEYSEYIK